MIGNVPDGWRVEKLGEVCQFINGYAFKSNEFKTVGVPIVRIGNLVDDKIELTDVICYDENTKLEPYIVVKEDILIAMSGATTGKIAFSNIEKKLYLNQRIGSIRVNKKILLSKYLFNFIGGKKSYLLSLAGGSAQPNLSSGDIKKLEIPLPPLPQQEKIVKVLDISSALVEKQRLLMEKYDMFLKSKFIEMFGDPISNPMGWEVEKLGDVCISKGEYGSGASAIEYDKNKPRYLRITDILESGYLSENKKSPSIIEEKYYMNKGDIVFARSGATVGKTYLHLSDEQLLFAGYLIRFVPNQIKINPTFLFYYTKTNFYDSWILSKQKVVAQPNINAKDYSALKIYLPPITLQNKFAQIVEKIEQIKEKENKKLTHLQTLHNSLMERAFKGEIK
ncbi:MAG TPA: restriction endonuclease subunit S [Sulfurimonas sp.]|uniref:restriction endonuclease subunit S n=1 Tax=Sulfurimonas sp. TaxID=2022749 RepID=UPI002C154106|nr:restriction endonuclease subunit S [Sulfurimonas sp.]HUH41582.1 restriction endonuclease subunit S [Sulfurimonas sp.]